MPDTGTCRGCGARIGWVRMDSGRPMPVDLEELALVVELGDTARLLKGFRPHWVSCPAAADFRRRPPGRKA